MNTPFTWPDGTNAVPPANYTMPEVGAVNWYTTINGFLTALGNGAQSTTFQKYAVQDKAANYTMSYVDCVVNVTVASVVIDLPAGIEKLVYTIIDGTATDSGIVVKPNGLETIGGTYNISAPVVFHTPRESITIIFHNNDWKILQWSQPTTLP